MVRHSALGICLAIAGLASAMVFVGIAQLLCISDGSYDPMRDDHYPGTMSDYYAHLARMMAGSLMVGIVAGIGAYFLRPRSPSPSSSVPQKPEV